MNSCRLALLVLLIGLASVSGCAKKHRLTPFRGDGCTLFPEKWEKSGNDWTECCEAHDVAYWQGGSKGEREAADLRFRECILERTGNELLAETMYNAVRLGGTPHFPSWYRWGYGWDYGRGYQPLSEPEREEVRRRLDEYRSGGAAAGPAAADDTHNP